MSPPAEGLASRLMLRPALRTQPDRRLVSLVREGYETAFEEIVRRYGRQLVRYAATIVGGRSEDVTQDAFSKALLALRRSSAEIELRPWLFRIVRNTALNDLRDSPPSPEVLAEALAGGHDPAEELEQREALADLMRRLQALPEPQRAAIVMRELEGLSHEEIAAALGLSGGAARQAIYRGRLALRNGLGVMVPLPLLKALLSSAGAGTVEAGVGLAGATGTGIALKATAATMLVAGAVGTGVAIENGQRTDRATATAPPAPASARSFAREVSASPVPAAATAGHTDRQRSGTAGRDSQGEDETASHPGRHGPDAASEREGTGGSPGDGGRSRSNTGGEGQRSPTQSESSSRSGRGSGEPPESSGERTGSAGDSEPEANSGSGGGTDHEGTESQTGGESSSGESGGGDPSSGESRDSQSGDGLIEQTAPEP